MKIFKSLILILMLFPLLATAEIKLIGDVDEETQEELLSFFHKGAQIFAGGYMVDEFEPGLDKHIISIQNDEGNYTVTTTIRPCIRTEFYLLKICYRDKCFWDLDSTYLCVHE